MTTQKITLADCRALDASDPLAKLRDQFDLPSDVIYLDGNSLGAMPKTSAKRAQDVITQEWGVGLIRSWNTAGWFDMPRKLGNQLARLVGGKDNEVIVTDTTSTNLFKVMAAALRQQKEKAPARRVIVSERNNFPTDLYITQGLMDMLSSLGSADYELRLVDGAAGLEAALTEDVAVVLLTHVNYQTGYMYDMADITAKAHKVGALTIWDLCHSAGAVPVDLNGANADYAVGCTYKFLNGGPGSPAFLWVNPKYQESFWQPLSGWWGHARPFAMESNYDPHQGVKRYLCGTQAITSLAMVENGLDTFADTNMDELRVKSLQLTTLFIDLVNQECEGFPLTLNTPLDTKYRGSQVGFEHPHGFAVVQALIERGVIPDYREPKIMRFGFTPLYIGFEDVWNAVAVLKDILVSKSWDQPKFHQRGTVT
ncbi:kynureninase [Diaphorobacter caeni]|uniref:kynureninase n=1 Tax=Diaphorobacter caeni TaxID=2784387 RepID=UPI00188F3ADB|nr:kynureninase [Diaphorobacter caeni]MBF5006771.1 kynureninase [Diaphorobacter caeni]